MKKEILTETIDGIEMPVIVLSIHFKWFQKIVTGEKTIELRKTIPHEGMPFKVIMLVTGYGAILGEFICRGYETHKDLSMFVKESCVSESEIRKYAAGNEVYGWKISDVKVYKGKIISNKSLGIKRSPQSWQYLRKVVE